VINAAIIGLGRWGQNLVNSVQGKSDAIRFVAGMVRNPAKAEDYARDKGFPLFDSYQKVLADPEIQAVVLATPHTLHAGQIVAAAKAQRSALKHLVDTFFGGSASRGMAALFELSGGDLDEAELRRLRQMIDEARKRGK